MLFCMTCDFFQNAFETGSGAPIPRRFGAAGIQHQPRDVERAQGLIAADLVWTETLRAPIAQLRQGEAVPLATAAIQHLGCFLRVANLRGNEQGQVARMKAVSDLMPAAPKANIF